MSAELAGIFAVLLAAFLGVAVGTAGGWRRVPPATDADQLLARPATGAAGLDDRGWRVRTVTYVLRLVLVLAIGLTPLGARFVHLVAPKGDTWHGTAAWLLILAVVGPVAALPRLWWRRQMRRTAPELFRPLRGAGQPLALAELVAGVLYLVLDVFLLVLDIRGEGHAYQGLSLILLVTAGLVLATRWIRIWRLPSSDRLSDLVSALPGAPRIPVLSGWVGAGANVGVVRVWRRPFILVAPPIAAALTDRELRAVVAHEVAHVQHGDVRRRGLRRLLLFLCVWAAAAALHGVPALRSMAG